MARRGNTCPPVRPSVRRSGRSDDSAKYRKVDGRGRSEENLATNITRKLHPQAHQKNSRRQSSRSHSSESDGQVSPFSSPCFLRCGHSIVGGALLAQLGRLTIALTKLYVQETCSSDTDGFVAHATFGFPLFGRTVDFLVSLAIAVTLIRTRTRTAANGGRKEGIQDKEDYCTFDRSPPLRALLLRNRGSSPQSSFKDQFLLQRLKNLPSRVPPRTRRDQAKKTVDQLCSVSAARFGL